MAALRLAMAFNEPDVDALLERMSLRQLLEWLEYLGLEAGDEGGLTAADIGRPRKTVEQMESILRARFGGQRGQ